MSSYLYTPELESLFKFTPKFGDPVNVSIREGGRLLVPRNLAPLGEEDYRTTRPLGAINCKAPPRDDEQKALIASSVYHLQQDHSHVFEAPTGFGKTYCGTAIAAYLGEATLIVVPKEDLVKAWRDTLINLGGVNPAEIGLIQQNKCEYKGKRFVIALVHSLVIPDRYPDEMYKYFGLVIFDEVHRMAADYFVQACHKLYAKYRLGFSATTERSDGKWEIIEAHIGPVRVKGTSVPMKGKVLVRKTGWQLPTVTRYVDNPQGGKMKIQTKLPVQAGKLMHVYKLMAKDPHRNAMIVEFVVSAYKAGRNILLLSDLIDDHLVPLFHLLAKAGIKGEEMGYYIGGKTDAQLKQAKAARVCLATYAMCMEGTDNPRWDTLVFCTPRANVKQGIGRILRKLEGKKQPVALDLVDYDALFAGYYLKREKQYYEIGAEIVKL